MKPIKAKLDAFDQLLRFYLLSISSDALAESLHEGEWAS